MILAQAFRHRLWRRARTAQLWITAQATFSVLALLRLLPPDRAMNTIGWLSRRLGPLMGRHRVAMSNLRLAFPDMPEERRREIALGMWDNMARLAAEYVFLDQIFDYDPASPEGKRIEVRGEEIFHRLTQDRKPTIFFTAHTGNFELLPVCAATFGLEITALFRPPNNPYVAKRLLSARRTRMGHLVPSRAGAAWALAGVLDRGGAVGMLVDQKFPRGARTTFFGQPVGTNPLVPKLARQFGCDVYPARCIRLPGGRFRLELEDRMELPRGPDGEIDIVASAQALNDKVESWVREYPDQWMWFHKRFKG